MQDYVVFQWAKRIPLWKQPSLSSIPPSLKQIIALLCSYLVWAETLQGVVGELVSHVHQVVIGVDVVQAVGLGFPRGFAHVFAVPKQTMEVEFVGILAICRQTRVAGKGKQTE